MSMRLPQRPIRQLDELSPGLRSLGLANLSTQGCALPAVDGTRAHYYRLDVLAELLERFASDETKAALIQTCNEASRTNAKWWFCPREEAIDVIENATLTRMALQQ